jgi:hypothetical protein
MRTPDRIVVWTLHVVRSGGFAGLKREWRVSSSDAPSVDWPTIISACPWQKTYPPTAERDRFVWRIEATSSRQTRTATLPESAVTGPWRTLVDQVTSAASE